MLSVVNIVYQNANCQFVNIDGTVALVVNNIKFIGLDGLQKLIKIRNSYVNRINLTFNILDGFTHHNYHMDIQKTYVDELDLLIIEFDTKLNFTR